MNKIGFLLTDLSSVYLLREIRQQKKNIAATILYDPIPPWLRQDQEQVDDYRMQNHARLEKLGCNEIFILGENIPGEHTWEKGLMELKEKEALWLHSPYRREGISLPLYYFLAEDGIIQRNFALHILRDYFKILPTDRKTIVLASPGMSYWRRIWEEWAERNQIIIRDPLDQIILPDTMKEGESCFYWTVRDFSFERRVIEILEENIRFRLLRENKWSLF